MTVQNLNDPKIIVALDFPSQNPALALADQLDPAKCRLKVGKELFTRSGPELVKSLQGRGFDVFLDLKFHDIPNTTSAAVAAAADLGVWMVNVHASGGRRMMEAARNELDTVVDCQTQLIAVTVLTSMERSDLAEIGLDLDPMEQVVRLARLTHDCGLDGVVRGGSTRRQPALLSQHQGGALQHGRVVIHQHHHPLMGRGRAGVQGHHRPVRGLRAGLWGPW